MLRPVLAGESLAPSAARALGLPAETLIGDLDEIGNDWSDDALAALGREVISVAQQRKFDLMVQDAPLFEARPQVDSLRLSPRTRNNLIRGGLVERGRLKPTTIGTVARIKGFGVGSLLELLTAVEEQPAIDKEHQVAPAGPRPTAERTRSRTVEQLAGQLRRKRWADQITNDDPRLAGAMAAMHPGADSPRQAAELLADASYLPGDAKRTANAIRHFIAEADALRRLPLDEEFEQLVSALTPAASARTALLARTGLGGEPPATLEASSRLIGVTRERIRQVERKLHERINECEGIWTPALDRTLLRIEELLPITAPELAEQLLADRLVSRRVAVESIISAAQLLHTEVPFSYDRQFRTLTRVGEWAPAPTIVRAARRLVEHWGTTTLADVEARVEEDGGDVDPNLLSVVLESIDGFGWLDHERGWFWIAGGRNRLLNQIEKIVSVAGSIELGELRAGVGRHHRMKGFRPPRAVLAELCVQSGLYLREGDRIVGGPNLPDWRDVLGENERTLAEVLFDHGPLLRREDLEQLAVREQGLNRNSFWVYLTYSPILERYAPGVWGLRGATVGAAEVEALIPPRVRRQVLLDHGWSADGELWAAFRISPAAEQSGVLGAPSAFRSVTSGAFELYSADERPVGTLQIEQNMWGLSPFFRRWGVEPGDYVVIRLNLSDRRAVIEAGDEDLLLRYQEAE